jgi:general secretion pathway protein C
MRLIGLINRPWAARSLSSSSGRSPGRTSSRLGRWVEVALLIVLATQIARLLWALVASTGPYGDWRAREPVVPGQTARSSLFSSFDPFYRLVTTGGGVQQVTSLPFQLFGIRVNEGSGLGSAIIADESGEQSSYSVGEEIAPGVKLSAVSHDHVVISRGGVEETLYINQSGEAPIASPEPADDNRLPDGTENRPPTVGEALTPDVLLAGIGLAPRMESGRMTGIVVSAQGSNGAFARSGFQPGDIIAQINGSPIRGDEAIADLRSSIRPGARLSLMVERGASTIPIALIIPDRP